MKNISPKANFLIEVAHEAVNLMGGIYRVIATKAVEMGKYYGDNYLVVGMYDPNFSKTALGEKTPSPKLKLIFDELKKDKIQCYYGEWLISGKPNVILTEPLKGLKLPKKSVFTKYKIPKNDKNLLKYNLWSYSVSKLIEKLLRLEQFSKKEGVVHFHHPTCGLALLDIIEKNLNIGVVFTLHDTTLGRVLAQDGKNLFKDVKKGNIKRSILRYGQKTIIRNETQTVFVQKSDVLTAVSEGTAKEIEYTANRKPDIITPNGLEMSKIPSLEERTLLHQSAKQRIYRFLNAYFLPYYSIDIPDSLLFFTSGRYELTTKGYDLLLEAFGKLNDKLRKEGYKNTIFVFLFIMTEEKEVNEEILENLAVYDAIEHLISKEFPNVEKRIINNLIHGEEIKKEGVFDDNFLIETKKLMLKFKRKENENPPICAFKGLRKEDPIMKLLLKSGLDNKEDDRVKVIFYPAPVSVADSLLSMEYNYLITGMHLGIFPSTYEPWGYTPLETAAHAVMSITTDIAGFGKFIMQNSDQRKKPGIFVLNTNGKKREDIISELSKIMHWVVCLPRKERIEKKLEAHKLAMLADWKTFAQYYIKAHNLAIERCKKRQSKIKK